MYKIMAYSKERETAVMPAWLNLTNIIILITKM